MTFYNIVIHHILFYLDLLSPFNTILCLYRLKRESKKSLVSWVLEILSTDRFDNLINEDELIYRATFIF